MSQESVLSIFELVSQIGSKVLHMKGNYGTVLGGILISTPMRMEKNKINRPMSRNPINSRLEIHYRLGRSRSQEAYSVKNKTSLQSPSSKNEAKETSGRDTELHLANNSSVGSRGGGRAAGSSAGARGGGVGACRLSN